MEWSEALDRLLTNPHDEQSMEYLVEEMEAEHGTPGQRRAFELVREGTDFVAALERGPDDVRSALARCPLHDVTPAPGEWTAHQVVGHLADNELVNAVRMRAVLTEPEPELYGYDSDDWTPFYALEPIQTLLERWMVTRGNTITLLRSLDRTQLSRRGLISYRGAETLRVLALVLAGHDRDHVEQIETTLASAREL